ncbi:MAG: hypothetical protein IJM61_05495 [Firmicutes bacterium]|nr:hypothetical protein [Bacillota bacterium]
MNDKKMTEKKKAVRFFCISMAILLIASIFIWGFQTEWGAVKIKRITITGDDGTQISSLAYIPRGVSAENKAPVVMVFHGRSNQGHSNDTWNMELARRGYVVYSPDLSGGGESDVNDRKPQAIAITRYVTTLNFVQTDNIVVVGYSAGCRSTNDVAEALPNNVSTIVAALGPNLVSPVKGHDFNFGVVKAVADQYNWEFIGDVEACAKAVTERFNLPEPVVVDKDYDINGKTFRYMVSDDTLHQTGNISNDTIIHIVDYIMDMVPAPNPIPAESTTWLPQQLFSGVACVTMMFALASFLNLLLQTEFFGSIKTERAARKAQTGVKAWILDVVFSIVIPALIFIHVSAYGMAWFASSKILTSTNLNGIMLWLVVVAIIGIVRTIIKTNKRKKAGETVSASDFCIAGPGEKVAASRIWKSLLLGVIAVCFFGLWMTAMEGFMGINYQVWNLATYLKPSPARIIKALPYMLIIFCVMFFGNINQRTQKSTGNERKDMVRAIIVNTVLTAGALFLLLVIQYGGNLMIGTGQAVFEQMYMPGIQGGSVGALDFAFGYCYMMGGTTAVVTYIYRKYGNIWAGVIPCAIFAGLFTLASFTLVR